MDNLNESSRANLAHFKGMNSRIDVTLDRTRAVEQGLVEVADLVKKANAPPTPLSREDIVAWNTSRMPPPPTPLEREEETASRKDSLMPPPSLPNKGPPRGYFSNAPWRTLVQFEILETLASIWNPERWGFVRSRPTTAEEDENERVWLRPEGQERESEPPGPFSKNECMLLESVAQR